MKLPPATISTVAGGTALRDALADLNVPRRSIMRLTSRFAIPVALFGLASCGDGENAVVPVPNPVAVSPDAGWPALHGPGQNSTSGETNLAWNWPETGPSVLWEKPTGKGYAVPVLRGDRLVTYCRLDDEEVLDCLDPATGERLWRTAFPTTYECDFEYSDGPYATPALTDDAVFAYSADGTLRRAELSTGELTWERRLAVDYEAEANPFAAGSSPLVAGKLVIVNVGGKKGHSGVVAVDATSGKTVWTATDHDDSYATPRSATIAGDDFVFVLTTTALVALDPADGRVRWQTPFGLKGGAERVTAVSPVVVNDLVIVTAGPGAGVLAVRVLPGDTFEEVWRDRRALDSQFNNVTTDGRSLFGFTSMWNGQAELRCLDLATGEVRWRWDSDLRRGSSMLVDGRLILLGENGHLAVVDAVSDGPTQRFFSKEPLLDGPTYTAPALYRGRLYLRNEKRLICLDLKSPARRTVTEVNSASTR